MLEVIERKKEDRQDFIAMFGFVPESVNGYKILLQRDYLRGKFEPEKEKFVSIYNYDIANLISGYRIAHIIRDTDIPNSDKVDVITIDNQPPDCCLDIALIFRNRLIREYKAGDKIVCNVDVYGNLHFIDFIHNARDNKRKAKKFFPILFKILSNEKHPMIKDINAETKKLYNKTKKEV